jgi:hypothetical protein
MRKAAPLDVESAEQYATRALGPELGEYACGPIVRMMLIADPDDVPVVELFSGLANIFASKICSLNGGEGRLPQILADRVGVELSSPVEEVSDRGDHVELSWREGDVSRRATFDACVLSCPLPVAATICRTGHRCSDRSREHGLHPTVAAIGNQAGNSEFPNIGSIQNIATRRGASSATEAIGNTREEPASLMVAAGQNTAVEFGNRAAAGLTRAFPFRG